MNAGDFLRVSVISSDTSYSVDSADSYFLVRTASLVPSKVGFSGAMAHNTAATSTPVGFTLMPMAGENYDTDEYHDIATNNSRMTIPEDGWYVFTGQYTGTVAQAGVIKRGKLRLNGTDTVAALTDSFAASTIFSTVAAFQLITPPLFLVTGDYMELLAGISPTDTSNSTGETYLAVERVDTLAAPVFLGQGYGFMGALAEKQATQSLTSGVLTALTFSEAGSTIFDEGGFHNESLNSSRMTIPPGGDGWYLVQAGNDTAAIPGATTIVVTLMLTKNGGIFPGEVFSNVTAGTAHSGSMANSVAKIFHLVAGDYIEAKVQQNSNPAVAYNADATPTNFLQITRLDRAPVANPTPSKCRLAAKAETYTNGVNKVVAWTEAEDTDNYFGGGTVTDEHVELPFTGRYRIYGKLHFDTVSNTFDWQVVVRLNRGATTTFNDDFPVLREDGALPTASTVRQIHLNGFIDVTAGDEIDILLVQGAVTRTLNVGSSFLDIEYLGPTP
jgi:hypothetical protein